MFSGMNDLYWLGPALVSGVLAVRFGLPPLVGYLIAGFVLNALGFNDHVKLTAIGNLGVTLLLFTIGLKLDVRSLLRPVIWAGTSLHMLAVIVIGTVLSVALASMHAKYLRERMMESLNRYFNTLAGGGLKPTAGYPVDADRFLADVDGLLDRHQIDRDTLVRCR